MKTIKAPFYFIFLIISITYSGCYSVHRTQSLKAQYKEVYIDQFKLTYLQKLLLKSYNNSTAVREIIRADRSGSTEPILTEEDYQLIDSLTTVDNHNLIADSTDGRRRAEGAQGKRPLRYIIDKLQSKWLDSLATRRLKLKGIPISWTD